MSTHIFEPITDRFGYGNYLDLRIIIDNKTNYINATKLCMLGGKKLFNWHKTDSSKELIACYNEGIEPPSDQKGVLNVSYEVKQEDVKGVTKKEQETVVGTYYHKSIIVHIAQWISPAFALKVSKIVDDYIGYENNRKIRELKGENKTLLDKVDDQSKQIAELLVTTQTILTINNEQSSALKQQNAKLDKMASAIEKMRVHLDNSTSVPSKREAILVYRNSDDSSDIMRFRCGTQAYLKTYKTNAKWYREYKNISNSKKAINYMKVNNMIEFEKDKTTKAIIPDQDDRLFIRKCLRKLDTSYLAEA